jgi:hypothetical protein
MRDASNQIDLGLVNGTQIQVRAVRILNPPSTKSNPQRITEDYFVVYLDGKPEVIWITDPGHLTIERVNNSEGPGAERWERCMESIDGGAAQTAS